MILTVNFTYSEDGSPLNLSVSCCFSCPKLTRVWRQQRTSPTVWHRWHRRETKLVCVRFRVTMYRPKFGHGSNIGKWSKSSSQGRSSSCGGREEQPMNQNTEGIFKKSKNTCFVHTWNSERTLISLQDVIHHCNRSKRNIFYFTCKIGMVTFGIMM